VSNCAIVYDSDEEFGSIRIANTEHSSDLPSSKIDSAKLSHLTEFIDVFFEKPGLCKVGSASLCNTGLDRQHCLDSVPVEYISH